MPDYFPFRKQVNNNGCEHAAGDQFHSSLADSTVSTCSSASTDSSHAYEKKQRQRKRRPRRASSYQNLSTAGRITTPIDRIPYVHGGYAAVAPLMINDLLWMDILERLMPDAHKKLLLIEQDEGPVRFMKWAENNPVVSAYGVLQGEPQDLDQLGDDLITELTKSSGGSSSTDDEFNPVPPMPSEDKSNSGQHHQSMVGRKKSCIRSREPATAPIEWDIFLDPNLVRKVEKAIQVAENVSNSSCNITAQINVDRQVSRLVSRMLLAHGSTSQLVTEALGVAPRYNFSRVEQSTDPKIKSYGTGIFVERWLALFAEALRLGKQFASRTQESYQELKSKGRGILSRDNSPRHVIDALGPNDFIKPPLCGLFLCLGLSDPNSERAHHDCNSMVSCLKSIKDILGVSLRVVLDLKSRRVPPRVWGRLLDKLTNRGLHVKGIGSFDVQELRAISSFCCEPVRQVIFFHAVGDLQRACHANEIRHGDTVYFNAGSLLWQKPTMMEATDMKCCGPVDCMGTAFPKARFVIQSYAYPRSFLSELPLDLSRTSTLEDYQKYYNLNIGLYVQEFSICEEALEVLTNFVNFQSSLYNLGMAWGGINGATVGEVKGDGYWNQRFMGRNWDLNIFPTDPIELLGEDNRIVREAMLADACGQVGTVNDSEEVSNVIQQGACAAGEGHQSIFDGELGRHI